MAFRPAGRSGRSQFATLDQRRLVVAWCELREAFRQFRPDRIAEASPTGKRYPKRRAVPIKDWAGETGYPVPE